MVGSGITASADAPTSVQLFHHAVVVGAALAVLIATFGPVSGAHFNPAVTMLSAVIGDMPKAVMAGYMGVQCVGGALGVVAANLLFGEPAVAIATTDRTGVALAASEAVATFGLLLVIFGILRSGSSRAVPAAVGAYITAAIYFTSSAAFANPAVTVARTLTDTFTGVAPLGAAGFVAAQLIGACAAAVVISWLFRPELQTSSDVVVPHDAPARAASLPLQPMPVEEP